MKDEGGLLWPAKEAVLMTGHCINTVEKLPNEQETLENFVILASVSNVELISLKELMMRRSVACSRANTTHDCCSNDCSIIVDRLIESMIGAFCKIGLSNFTKLAITLSDSAKKAMKQATEKKNENTHRGACTDTQCVMLKNKNSNGMTA